MGMSHILEIKSTYKSPNNQIRQCQNCGSGITWPSPTKEELALFYAKNYDYLINRSISNEKGKRARSLLKNILIAQDPDKEKNLLDLGCMQGYLLEEARNLKILATGLEISEDAAKEAERKGFHIFTCPIEDVPETFQFNIITAQHVLEHILNPEVFLNKAKKLLKKEGIICFCVPNFESKSRKILGKNWGWYQTPGHIHHFSKKGIESLLKRCSLEPIQSYKRGGDSLFVLITLAFLLNMQPQKEKKQPLIAIKFLSRILSYYEKMGDEETVIIAAHARASAPFPCRP